MSMKTNKKSKLMAVILAVVMMLTLVAPTIALAAAHTPPADAPYGGPYDVGDNVPTAVMTKALTAVLKPVAQNGMVGIPYSTYDCSDFVEYFLRDYVGYKQSAVNGKTAQGFYTAFNATGDMQTMPTSIKTDAAAISWMESTDIKPGALLFYEDPDSPGHCSHIGVYLGNGKIVDSISNGSNEGVKERVFHLNTYDISHPEKGGFYAYVNLSTEQLGSVKLIKSSATPAITNGNSCYSLEGAVYDVFLSADRTNVGSITTNAQGEGTLTDIPIGNYYIKEKTAPKGYALDTKEYPVVIEEDKTTVLRVTDKAQNDPANILLRKLDNDTNSAVAQGTASLGGAQFTYKYYDGFYSTAAELAGKTPLKTWVFETDENGVIIFDESYLVSGDSFFEVSGETTLPLGTVTVQETLAPEGYLIDSTLFIRQITSEGVMEDVHTYNEPIVKETVIRGGVRIEKRDIELGRENEAQGNATLQGAVLEIINRNDAAVSVLGVSYAKDAVVYTASTDANAVFQTAKDLLPFGDYTLREKTAPNGYLNTGVLSRDFSITENNVIVELSEHIENDVIRGGVRIEKWDNETNKNEAQGGATLEKAVFEIINRSTNLVLVNGVEYAPGETVLTLETDENGAIEVAADVLPHGTYDIVEVSAPKGYLASGILSRTFSITEDGVIVEMTDTDTAIKNNPIRGDIEGVKIADGSNKRLANVPFRITSKTTGESHVVVTDRNGQFSTASDWNPHGQNTNRGESDEDGIWFGEIDTLNENLGALLYDTYTIEELRCDANEGYILLKFDFEVYRHNNVIDLSTLTNDLENVPEVWTTAIDSESGTNDAFVSEETTIVDTVYYNGLTIGKDYVVKGILMDKKTEQPLLVDGKEVTAETTFKARQESGTVSLSFTFDSSALRGTAVVVFESIELDGVEVASHSDLEDKNQTITFVDPKIGTQATDKEGNKRVEPNKEVTIIDTVSYENLLAGKEYTLSGILMDKETEKPLLVDGKEVTAETTFKAKESSGTVTVEFTFDASALKGKEIVVFEALVYNEIEIATHSDITDKGQTIQFIEPGETPGKKLKTGLDTFPMFAVIICIVAALGAIGFVTYKAIKKKKAQSVAE